MGLYGLGYVCYDIWTATDKPSRNKFCLGCLLILLVFLWVYDWNPRILPFPIIAGGF